MIYYIYHLPGKKVGCTNNLFRRLREYRAGGYTGPFQILEKLSCGIKEAGDREWLWAHKFGYRKGWHYSLTAAGKNVKTLIRAGRSKANPNRIRFKS